MEIVSISLSKEDKQKLIHLSKALGVDRSKVIRALLKKFSDDLLEKEVK